MTGPACNVDCRHCAEGIAHPATGRIYFRQDAPGTATGSPIDAGWLPGVGEIVSLPADAFWSAFFEGRPCVGERAS